MRTVHWIAGLCTAAGLLYAGPVVKESNTYQAEGSAKRIYRGTVELPAQGIWLVDSNSSGFFVVAPEEAYDQLTGRRMAEVIFQDQLYAGSYGLRSINYACRSYALTNGNLGPASVNDLGTNDYSYAINRFNGNPWEDTVLRGKELKGPYAYLIPNVEFRFVEGEQYVRSEDRELLAFELQPYVDDGRHWVCYTDGRCQRVEIDPEMVNSHGQEIRPVYDEKPNPTDLPEMYAYTIFAEPKPGATMTGEQIISLWNAYGDARTEITWDLASAGPGDESLMEELREFELSDWWCYHAVSDAPVLAAWMAMAGEAPEPQGRRRGESTSAFGVMGGYAAVRETLQMQLINAGREDASLRTIPVEDLEGVKVASHPYQEMLGESPGGQLDLAELSPTNSLFVYVARPKAILPMLDEGAGFVSELGGALTGNRIKYQLAERYLGRFGVDKDWLELFIKSGGVKECALLSPDMFFLDGTDITFITRMSNARLIIPMLRVVGVPTLSDQKVSEKVSPDGSTTYWTIRDDLLLASTSRQELQRVMDLHAADGEGSLGKSAEFRYMLTQLPVSEKTRVYAYCSDAFIRRLVGPETKIGQLRRVNAINDLTLLTAGALLARHDGFGVAESLDALRKKGYLPESFDIASGEYTLDTDLVAHSKTYGTLADLAPIGNVPVDLVSSNEASAYGGYVENYSRFWRQFFDPIALRLDDTSDGALEASVFILPLIDNSIYNGIKEVVMAQESGVPMRVPRFSPDPVLQFSVNLKEEAWTGVAEGLSEMLVQFWDVDSAILDDLGPSVHIAINDGDPVIALGSGDILGAFGGNGALFGDDEMFIIPMAISVLTRPCTIAVETGNPEKTIMHLRHASEAISDFNLWLGDEFTSEIYQIEDRDAWVCMFDIMGVVKLRYGLEVKDGFLLIRNIPWSSKDRIDRVEYAELNGAELKVWPAACNLQLPGLHATAGEKERAAAFQGMGFLYPLVADGYASLETAFGQHLNLFGFTPRQAPDDQWAWVDDAIESSLYGSVFHKKQPAYDEEADFGLMGGIEDVSIQMQFEETGLRSSIRWKTRN